MTTSERTRFDELCEELSLHAEWTEAEGYQIDADGWEHQVFRFTWSIGDDTIGSRVHYQQGLGIEREPIESDLLSAVCVDASVAAPYAGVAFDDAWILSADELGYFQGEITAESLKREREAFRACRAWFDLLRERLGEENTERLLEAAGEL